MLVVLTAGQRDSGRLLNPGQLPVQGPIGTVPGEVSPLFRRFRFLLFPRRPGGAKVGIGAHARPFYEVELLWNSRPAGNNSTRVAFRPSVGIPPASLMLSVPRRRFVPAYAILVVSHHALLLHRLCKQKAR